MIKPSWIINKFLQVRSSESEKTQVCFKVGGIPVPLRTLEFDVESNTWNFNLEEVPPKN